MCFHTEVFEEGVSVSSEVRFCTIRVCSCELWNYITVQTELNFVRVLIDKMFVFQHSVKITILTSSKFYKQTNKQSNFGTVLKTLKL